VPLVVFKTRDRGWGVRTEWPLERGEYVCEYAGAIISSEEATGRQAQGGHNYVMSLREHLASGQILVTCIDPTDKGNVGRYFNHSCDPNLAIVLVRAGSFVPRAAFFCTRPVPRGEELTFFYGDNASSNASSKPTPEELQKSTAASRRICRCGAKRCMGFLPFDA
jgi:[histone H3]-lysine36 N-dimethyltransferase SETMAR